MYPIVTTIQRKAVGLTRPATLPPNVPPINAPTAMTSATIQLTFPEKTKMIAAAPLAEKAISCLMAFKRVRVSFMINPRTARMITLMPAPK